MRKRGTEGVVWVKVAWVHVTLEVGALQANIYSFL